MTGTTRKLATIVALDVAGYAVKLTLLSLPPPPRSTP